MPYITKARKRALLTRPAGDTGGLTGADLAWSLTENVAEFLSQEGVSYSTLASAVSALESAKHELQRRIIAPYEDTKVDDARPKRLNTSEAAPVRVDPFADLLE